MVFNKELSLAWQIINNTDTHLFLTGKAGTGKTTFLKELRRQSMKRMVVLAPTGIAAINAQGSTIHSFFQLNIGPQLPNMHSSRNKNYSFKKNKIQLIRSLDLIVIDEISMVRADLLDAVDIVLRRFRNRQKPFGGVQMLMIGDMQQLSPVAKDEEWKLLSEYYQTPYFFSSNALKSTDFVTVELQEVFRQSDPVFLELLNKVRNNTIDDSALSQINTRYIPNFAPRKEEGYIRLCTHNRQADYINQRDLESLDAPATTFTADIEGDFPTMSYPTDKDLSLKVGAQVMFIKNDSSPEKAYFNGMIGEILQFDEKNLIHVRCLDDERIVKVGRERWENTKYYLDNETKEISEEIVGSFEQYPLKTAWAITVHKSQGLTFTKAILDIQYSFAHGQAYVALSRCKSLEGLVLSSPIARNAIINDSQVEQFYNDPRHSQPDSTKLKEMEVTYRQHTIDDLFSMLPLIQGTNDITRLLREHFYTKLPKTYAKWNEAVEKLKELDRVAHKFHNQYSKILIASNEEQLQERLVKGASYFENELLFFRILLKSTLINTNNIAVQRRSTDILTSIKNTYQIKFQLLHYVANNGFKLQEYLKTKTTITLKLEDNDPSSKYKNTRKSYQRKKDSQD